jgi:hypothetical protein
MRPKWDQADISPQIRCLQREDAGTDEEHSAVFAESLPDEPCAADLGGGGEQEQGDGTCGDDEGIVSVVHAQKPLTHRRAGRRLLPFTR